ncbi:MFS multidrug transporter-like protein [Dendryphion nanum]|uniref:MFS multidrug transporter-like protein n=1 Tax=Dendryphion nanum TaxID=256645 RepID=A0A9P9D9V9_9PLEO|nr:MFS multidrug transporter-like protein [Dendryphion nanum]
MTASEETPLLQPVGFPNIDHGVRETEIIIDFVSEGDVENPRDWPATYKWAIVSLLAFMAFTVTFTCISVVPIAANIAKELDGADADSSSTAVLVTIWELGEAFGPLLIAPLSEIFGRYPVMNGCNILFIFTTLLAATSNSTKLFIAARALTGATVASNVLNPAIIGDMFESEQRGSAMSLVTLTPLIGGAVGPAISSAIADTLGWREVLFIATGIAVVCELLFLVFFRETYQMTILRRQLAKLEKKEGIRHNHASRENLKKILHSITRPVAILYSSSVLMMLSGFSSVAFSYYYVMCTSLPEILHAVYGFSPALTGTAFMSFSAGSFLAVLLSNFALDRIFIYLRGPDHKDGKPEHRLPLALIGAFTLPLCVTAYGWVAELHLPVPLLLVCVGLLGFTLVLTTVPVFAYVVDAFGPYSASAITGIIVIRCLISSFLPLITGPLAKYLGNGWGFTYCGAFSLCLAPVSILVFRYGYRWRQRCEFTRDEWVENLMD